MLVLALVEGHWQKQVVVLHTETGIGQKPATVLRLVSAATLEGIEDLVDLVVAFVKRAVLAMCGEVGWV